MMRITSFCILACLALLGSYSNIATAQNLTTLHSFVSGGSPENSPALLQGGDGNLYGADGASVFRISSSGGFTDLSTNFGFASAPNSLVQGADGNLYGTTFGTLSIEGSSTVFKITPAGELTTLWSFPAYTSAVGLVPGSDGSNFYGGTLANAGAYNNGDYIVNPLGKIFTITQDGTLTNLDTFADGSSPTALLLANDGNFYGTTVGYFLFASECGVSANGTIFEMTPAGTIKTLLEFDGTNGWAPGRLVQYLDGTFYGTTRFGGQQFTSNCSRSGNPGNGTIFRLATNGVFKSLYSFTGGTDGADPGSLIIGIDGNLYGITTSGGSKGDGTVFQITTNGTLNTIVTFDGANGANPSVIIQGDDGDLYGVTSAGGKDKAGVVFKLDIGQACTFSLDSTSAIFDSEGGTSDVMVVAKRTNCVWTATSNDGFITINSGSSGSGNGRMSYSVAANTGLTSRSGTITIADQTFVVTQAAPCRFSLSPTLASVSAGGGPKTVKVKSGVDCNWSAASGESFITITAGTNGAGNGSVILAIAPNLVANARTGTVNIADQTLTVVQKAAKCSFTTDSNGATFGLSGGSSNIVVTSNGGGCAWKVVNNAKFVTITSATEFTGDGIVTYSIATNATGKARTGTLVVAGKPFKITQADTP